MVPPLARMAATAVWKPAAVATDRTGAVNGRRLPVSAAAGAPAIAARMTAASSAAPARRVNVDRLPTTGMSPRPPRDLRGLMLRRIADGHAGHGVMEYTSPRQHTRRDVNAPALAARGAARRLQLRLGQRHRTGAVRGVGRRGAASCPRRR